MSDGIQKVIEALYKGDTGEQRWTRVAQAMSSLMQAHVVRITATDARTNELLVDALTEGWPDDLLREYDSQYMSHDPRIKGAMRNLGTSVACTDIVDHDTFDKSPLVRDLLDRPSVDARWSLMRISRAFDGAYLRVGASRRRADGAFVANDKRQFDEALRHILHVLELDARIAALDREKRTLAESLDAVASATVILTRDLHVLHVNVAASQLIGEGRGLRLVGGRLTATRPADHTALESAVRQADGAREGLGHPPLTVVIHNTQHEPVLVRAYALARSSFMASAENTGQCVLILTVGKRQPDNGLDAVLGSFGLTTAEQRVVRHLIQGSRLSAVAKSLDVSIETVRSQLKSAHGKIGVRRQSDLVRLLSQYLR
jgi:DNA-binding CsgD family transcriptional regulator/PAS domain-containing protein